MLSNKIEQINFFFYLLSCCLQADPSIHLVSSSGSKKRQEKGHTLERIGKTQKHPWRCLDRRKGGGKSVKQWRVTPKIFFLSDTTPPCYPSGISISWDILIKISMKVMAFWNLSLNVQKVFSSGLLCRKKTPKTYKVI